jgi:hypothetical protein
MQNWNVPVDQWGNLNHRTVPVQGDVLKVLTDSSHNNATTYYVFDGTQWQYSSKTPLLQELADEYIPDYWQPELKTAAEGINSALTAAGQNKAAFLFYSDCHWNEGVKKAPRLLKALYKTTGINKTFYGGDIVSEESDMDTDMSYLWEWRRQLKGLPNHHSVVGNHDDGNIENNRFSQQYVYAFLQAPEETPDIVRDTAGLWYYIDNPSEHCRYLFLDTAYQGVTAEQLAFINSALISTPDGWNIVAVSHIWFANDYSIHPPTIVGIDPSAVPILDLFDKYNSRVQQYADCTGWVQFCIGGHNHRDHFDTTATGIPVIVCDTDGFNTRDGNAATYGTITESCISGIVGDFNNHVVHVIRAGRGESFDVDIESRPINYTNLIPLSTELDGVTIYNVSETPGYKANMHWSGTSNGEYGRDGNYTTGWLPVPPYGTTYYVKNFGITSSSQILLTGFDTATGQTRGQSNGANFDTYNSPVWDTETGELVSFHANIETGADLWRIEVMGGATITDMSILTREEVID